MQYQECPCSCAFSTDNSMQVNSDVIIIRNTFPSNFAPVTVFFRAWECQGEGRATGLKHICGTASIPSGGLHYYNFQNKRCENIAINRGGNWLFYPVSPGQSLTLDDIFEYGDPKDPIGKLGCWY